MTKCIDCIHTGFCKAEDKMDEDCPWRFPHVNLASLRDIADALVKEGLKRHATDIHRAIGENPDTWERIEADAGKLPREYFGCRGQLCDKCPKFKTFGECMIAKSRDLVRRCRELAR